MRVVGSTTLVLCWMTGCGEAPTGATFRPLLEASGEVSPDAMRITPERAERVAPVQLGDLPPLQVAGVHSEVAYGVSVAGLAFLPDTRLVRVGMGAQNTTCVLDASLQGPAPDVDYPGSGDDVIDVLHGTTDLGVLVGTDFGAWLEENQVGGGNELDLSGAVDALLVDEGVVRLSSTVHGCELSTARGDAHDLPVSACQGTPVLTANPRTGVVYTVADDALLRIDGGRLTSLGLAAEHAAWDPVGAHLLVLSPLGEVYALDADDGERWRVRVDGARQVAPLGAAAGVAVVTESGVVLLDAVDGTEVWREVRPDLDRVVVGWGGERIAFVAPDAVTFAEVDFLR